MGSGRVETSGSLNLELHMNMMIRVMTIEELLLTAKNIDEMDDIRRKEAFNLDKWLVDSTKGFEKKRQFILDTNDIDTLKKRLRKHDEDVKAFFEKYYKSREENKAKEIYLEELDDGIRARLLELISHYREQIRDENSGIEKQMMRENIDRKHLIKELKKLRAIVENKE